MKCHWQAYLNLLPPHLRPVADKVGPSILEETRLRLGQPVLFKTSHGCVTANTDCTSEDLSYCINLASHYSPWSASSAAHGYLTGEGGHRMGICGQIISREGSMEGIRNPTSICLRLSRDLDGVSKGTENLSGSILIIGPPGSGKTTFLRDLIRQISDNHSQCIAVVDEKEEIFPLQGNTFCFPVGKNTDVLSGCTKWQGIDAILRNMGPASIAVDEITAENDCQALLSAAWCGVRLIATAHASTLRDLENRAVYKPIVESGLFDHIIVLHPDKHWSLERSCL